MRADAAGFYGLATSMMGHLDVAEQTDGFVLNAALIPSSDIDIEQMSAHVALTSRSSYQSGTHTDTVASTMTGRFDLGSSGVDVVGEIIEDIKLRR